ncbi:MAG: glutamyl-tRNA reductase [Deltaproteobacteria bacterium]|nr:glutamyl-tRNA reductase [Deltaproteobacteria bacterium]
MSELFVVGISWRTAPVAVREKLAFREEEVTGALAALTSKLPVSEALLISTCNRVEVYGVARPGHDATGPVRQFLAEQREVKLATLGDALYHHRGSGAIRHVFRVASALDSLVVGEAQILGQLKAAYGVAGTAGTSGPLLGRCLERAFRVAKRVRTETLIARGAANVSSVAVELAHHIFGDMDGKSVLVVGAGKMSRLAARHLYASGAARIVVTNRSPAKAEALAGDVDGVAKPWEHLESLLAEADVVISSTGAREPVLTKALFKKVTKARRWRPMMVIDIAVPRDAEPAIGEFDGVFLYDIDDLDKVLKGNIAEREKAAEAAGKIVEHEAAQFEQWIRTQGVVPTIRAMRTHFTKVAELEVQKVLEQLARKDHSAVQQREVIQRLVQLVVNKLLHQPTIALREAGADEATVRAAVLCDLFGLIPEAASDRDSQPVLGEPEPLRAESRMDVEVPERKAAP